MAQIRYPYARLADGSAISIRDYTKGIEVSCFGCARRLVGHQGKRKRWHFAHAVESEHPCNAETALHRLSKAIIVQRHQAARATCTPYPLTWTCPGCTATRTIDCARDWTHVDVEARRVPATCSDLFFDGRRSFALEIVVTHDPEQAALAAYEQADVPVFVVRPTWEDVSELAASIMCTDAHGVRTERCASCQDELRKKHALEALVIALPENLRRVRGPNRDAALSKLHEWPPSVDRFGRPLRIETRLKVREQGARCLALGFTPHPMKPWIMTRRLPGGLGTAYVGLGGDEQTPLWRSTAVSVYVPVRLPQHHAETIERALKAFLEEHGVEVYSAWAPTTIEFWEDDDQELDDPQIEAESFQCQNGG